MFVVGSAGPAGAQSSRADALLPGYGPFDVVGVRAGRVLPHLGVHAGVALGYVNDSVVGTGAGGKDVRLVHHRASAFLVGGVGLFDWVDVGLIVPVVLESRSQSFPEGGGGQAGLGSAHLVTRLGLVGRGRDSGFGLALVVDLGLPTHSDGLPRQGWRWIIDSRPNPGSVSNWDGSCGRRKRWKIWRSTIG